MRRRELHAAISHAGHGTVRTPGDAVIVLCPQDQGATSDGRRESPN
jgi:hypothetical protein